MNKQCSLQADLGLGELFILSLQVSVVLALQLHLVLEVSLHAALPFALNCSMGHEGKGGAGEGSAD